MNVKNSGEREKLRCEISCLTPEEKGEKLIECYRDGTTLKLLAALFTCTFDNIVDYLKLVDIKICTQCHKEKSWNDFHIANSKSTGYHSHCKECAHKKRKKYYQESEKDNPQKYEDMIAWKRDNRERVRELRHIRNQDPVNKKKNAKYMREKVNSDPVFKLRLRFSNLLYYHLKEHTNGNVAKNGKSINDILDYKIEDLVEHLEGLFREGMTWNNYGDWHIDHKKPVSLFNITSLECDEFKECWSLENLQPLWAQENFIKGNRYTE